MLRAGGKLDLHCGDPIRLRVLLDGSVCEVFTSIGAVLTLRINRSCPLHSSPALCLLPDIAWYLVLLFF